MPRLYTAAFLCASGGRTGTPSARRPATASARRTTTPVSPATGRSTTRRLTRRLGWILTNRRPPSPMTRNSSSGIGRPQIRCACSRNVPPSLYHLKWDHTGWDEPTWDRRIERQLAPPFSTAPMAKMGRERRHARHRPAAVSRIWTPPLRARARNTPRPWPCNCLRAAMSLARARQPGLRSRHWVPSKTGERPGDTPLVPVKVPSVLYLV